MCNDAVLPTGSTAIANKCEDPGDPRTTHTTPRCPHHPCRYWHITCTRLLIVLLLIACALCVTGLSNVQRAKQDELNFDFRQMDKEIGLAGAAIPPGQFVWLGVCVCVCPGCSSDHLTSDHRYLSIAIQTVINSDVCAIPPGQFVWLGVCVCVRARVCVCMRLHAPSLASKCRESTLRPRGHASALAPCVRRALLQCPEWGCGPLKVLAAPNEM